ncbi:MAG: hypothetical protein E4H27_07270 [Anaerolineales bacterium]|nr:MAG: hypothetical protein E4H27_07270 [Anaerolineales bacterium]
MGQVTAQKTGVLTIMVMVDYDMDTLHIKLEALQAHRRGAMAEIMEIDAYLAHRHVFENPMDQIEQTDAMHAKRVELERAIKLYETTSTAICQSLCDKQGYVLTDKV